MRKPYAIRSLMAMRLQFARAARRDSRRPWAALHSKRLSQPSALRVKPRSLAPSLRSSLPGARPLRMRASISAQRKFLLHEVGRVPAGTRSSTALASAERDVRSVPALWRGPLQPSSVPWALRVPVQAKRRPLQARLQTDRRSATSYRIPAAPVLALLTGRCVHRWPLRTRAPMSRACRACVPRMDGRDRRRTTGPRAHTLRRGPTPARSSATAALSARLAMRWGSVALQRVHESADGGSPLSVPWAEWVAAGAALHSQSGAVERSASAA